MDNTTYMGYGQSCTCCISFSQSHYSSGQLLNGCIHLLFKEAGLGVLHCVFGWVTSSLFLGSGDSPFGMVDGSASLLKIFRTQQLRFGPSIIISLIVVSHLWTLTGASQYFK